MQLKISSFNNSNKLIYTSKSIDFTVTNLLTLLQFKFSIINNKLKYINQYSVQKKNIKVKSIQNEFNNLNQHDVSNAYKSVIKAINKHIDLL